MIIFNKPIQMFYKNDEVTVKLLASLLGQPISARVRKYIWQDHYCWRDGQIVIEGSKYFFKSDEYYSILNILEVKTY